MSRTEPGVMVEVNPEIVEDPNCTIGYTEKMTDAELAALTASWAYTKIRLLDDSVYYVRFENFRRKVEAGPGLE